MWTSAEHCPSENKIPKRRWLIELASKNLNSTGQISFFWDFLDALLSDPKKYSQKCLVPYNQSIPWIPKMEYDVNLDMLRNNWERLIFYSNIHSYVQWNHDIIKSVQMVQTQTSEYQIESPCSSLTFRYVTDECVERRSSCFVAFSLSQFGTYRHLKFHTPSLLCNHLFNIKSPLHPHPNHRSSRHRNRARQSPPHLRSPKN